MAEYFNIFKEIFDFIFSFLSIKVLGDYSILDVCGWGIIVMAITRMLILPIFGKFGSFGSSSVEKMKGKKNNDG